MPNSGVPLRPLNTQYFSGEVSILPSLLGEVDLVVNMLTLDSNYIQYTILRSSFISHQLSTGLTTRSYKFYEQLPCSARCIGCIQDYMSGLVVERKVG